MTETLALFGGKPGVDKALHVRWPVITTADKAAVMAVLERGVFSGPLAPEVRALEAEFAQFAGTQFCLATNSGTAALHIAVAAAGIGPGDEVITPAFSFVATAMSVMEHGAIPTFVDIEPRTFCMDPAKIEAAITPRTKAIMPVHMHGMPCDMDAILAIAKKHNLVVIEDAAQAHGASYKGRAVGTMGAAAGFSMQSSKNLSAGEGGLFVTNDEQIYKRANRTRMFGEDTNPRDPSGFKLERPLDMDRAYDSMAVGWMYRTNEMTAALARSQLARLPGANAQARHNGAQLSEALAKLPGVTPPVVPEGLVTCWHKYRVMFDASQVGVNAPAKRVRAALLAGLRAEGVDTVLWQTQPIPGQSVFKERVGFGKGYPWALASEGGQLVDYAKQYDSTAYPVTQRVLDNSLCLFSQSFPIAPQPASLIEQYAHAFAKVWANLAELVEKTPA